MSGADALHAVIVAAWIVAAVRCAYALWPIRKTLAVMAFLGCFLAAGNAMDTPFPWEPKP